MKKPVRPQLVPPAEGQRHKRFRLSIVGADEDVPRLVRAYGRACQGEFGLVLRPPEQRGVLVLVTKKDGSFTWEGEADADSPRKPAVEAVGAAAVALVKDAQKSPPKVGPVTLRGRWTGYLYCEGGLPRVELRRRLATYGTLWVFSNGADGWAWTFERDGKWFGGSGETHGKGLPTLLDALHIAVLGAMTLVKDACSFRDTHRRAAHDDDYAAKHPIKKREPKRNPTERLKEPRPKKPRARKTKPAAPKPRRASAPRSVNSRDAAPEVPQDAGNLQEMADKAQRAAQDLVAVDDIAPDWELLESPAQIGKWFDDGGWQGIGEAIIEYATDPTYPVAEFLSDVKKDLRAAETVHDDDPDPAIYAEARRKLDTLRQALHSAPLLLERARRLIRYARSMARSPLCKGAEQKAALKAVEEARKAYEATREKIRKGHRWDPDRALRRVGEKVALAAAKASKACSSGQTKLPTAAKPAKPKAPKKRAASPKPKSTRKARPAKAPKGAAEVDADKDKALIDAFSKAFAAVLGDEAA